LREASPHRRLLSVLGYGLYAVGAVWLLLELAGAAGLVSYKDRLGGTTKFALGFHLAPNKDVHGETHQDTAYTWGIAEEPIRFHFKTDDHGLRNASHRDDADVYLLGDSIVVGALVPFERTVTAELEAALGLDVMNVALLSIGPQQQHELIRDLPLPLEGRTVVQFIFEGNDQKDSETHRTKRRGDAKRKRKERGALEKAWRRSLTKNLIEAFGPGRDFSREIAERTCHVAGQLYTFHYGRAQVHGLDDEIAHVTASLEEFRSEVEAQGGRYVVAFVPTKLHTLAPLCEFPEESDLLDLDEHLGPLRERLVAWGAESGVPVLDLTPPLQAAAREGRVPWFWGDTHWNAEGHRVAAQALASWPALRGAVGGD
jgi:hypothetical protein